MGKAPEPVVVEIELPRDVVAGLNVPLHRLTAQVKEWVVLEIFREGRISAGKARELLGVSRDGFHDLLKRHDLPLVDAKPGELEADLAVAEQAMAQASTR